MERNNMIVIVDFGGQTTHLIGRRIGGFGIETPIVHPEDAIEFIRENNPAGVILSGGPSSVYEEVAPTIDPAIFELDVPLLGICYGWQITAHLLQGDVKPGSKEYGPADLSVNSEIGIFENVSGTFSVWDSHGDSVSRLPEGFEVIASTPDLEYAGVYNAEKNIFGVQFHPEVVHTENGLFILENFASLCGCEISHKTYDPDAMIADIKEKVGDKKVIFGVSGGVDSTVAAFLVGKAIGKNLIPVYVDSGLMKPGTTEIVRDIFTNHIEADLQIIEAQDRFLGELEGIEDPEVKRKTIGKLYVDIFDEVANTHSDAHFLGQGTIYSDVIESKGSKNASNIKSHHNVGGLPKHMQLELLEPVRNLYKDEVREVGKMVGLPDEILFQHPFPGPGYGVRIRGEVTRKRLDQCILANQILEEEVRAAGLWDTVFQCFAVMSGAYSTAVKGDARAFSEVVAIRSYESQDIMSSDWSYFSQEVLGKISTRIVNEVPDVSRVVLDITTKPPATMEWE